MTKEELKKDLIKIKTLPVIGVHGRVDINELGIKTYTIYGKLCKSLEWEELKDENWEELFAQFALYIALQIYLKERNINIDEFIKDSDKMTKVSWDWL